MALSNTTVGGTEGLLAGSRPGHVGLARPQEPRARYGAQSRRCGIPKREPRRLPDRVPGRGCISVGLQWGRNKLQPADSLAGPRVDVSATTQIANWEDAKGGTAGGGRLMGEQAAGHAWADTGNSPEAIETRVGPGGTLS